MFFVKKSCCYLPIRLFDSIDQHRFVIVDQTEEFIDHFFLLRHRGKGGTSHSTDFANQFVEWCLDIPHLKLVEKECQLVLLVDGKISCVFQVLEAFDLDLVAVAEVNKKRLFFCAIIRLWGEFKPFLDGNWHGWFRANCWGGVKCICQLFWWWWCCRYRRRHQRGVRSRGCSDNLLWCHVWWTCRRWPNWQRQCRWRGRNSGIFTSPMWRSIISANRW